MIAKIILRRLGFLFLTLLLTSVLIFAATQFLPGDIARVILGREAGDEAVSFLPRLQYFCWPQRCTHNI